MIKSKGGGRHTFSFLESLGFTRKPVKIVLACIDYKLQVVLALIGKKG
jgi:hypothetical protein